MYKIVFAIAFALQFVAFNAFSGAGIYDSYAIVQIGNRAQAFYDLGAATANPDFDTETIYINTAMSLKLGGQSKSYKNNGSDVTGHSIQYRIYTAGSPSGSFNTINYSYQWGFGDGGAPGNLNNAGDQQWGTEVTGANGTDGITEIVASGGLAAGTYTIEVYHQITTNGTDAAATIYNNNGGSNFTMTLVVMDIPGNALDFDGDNDYVNLGNDASFQLSIGTVECWFKASSQVTGYAGLIVKQNAYGLFLNNGILGFYDWMGGFRTSGLNLVDNEWHHVAFVFNSGVANGSKVFLDGSLVLTDQMTVNLQTVALAIGSGIVGTGQEFHGLIDEVRIWNDIRTHEEIIENMYSPLSGNEAGLVAYYNFDQGAAGADNSGVTTLYDLTGNTFDGSNLNVDFTLNGSTSNWVSSGALIGSENDANKFIRAGNSLDFDGTDDWVDVPRSASLESPTSAVTLEAWIYPTSFGANFWENVIVEKAGGQTGYMMRIGNAGYLDFAFGNGTLWYGLTITSTVIELNKWQHVVSVYDGTTMKLYLNGIKIGENAVSTTISHSDTPDLGIGRSNIHTDRFFDGKIDEVRIWSDARTEAEIRGNMFTRLSGTEANLVAYYTFDAESGTTLADKTSNGNDGTLDGGPTWTSASDREAAKAYTADGNWNTASTWLDGSVPNASTQSVFVPVNITLDATVDANIVNVASGATLTIDNGNTLSATGNVLNDGTITIENTGALVQGSSSGLGNGGTFNVKKTAFGNTGALQYNVFSAPISDGSVNSLGNNRYWFDPSAATTTLSDGWQAASGAMTVGRGYFATNSNNVTFSGTANNGDITYTATAATNGSDKIMNLIGNPYPSGLNLTNFMANATNNANLTGTLYFWDDDGTAGSSYATNGYATWSGGTWTQSNNADKTGAGTAAGSAQGFIVVPKSGVADGSFNIEFTNSMREGNSTVFFKQDFQRLWINLQDDSIFMSQTAVVLNDQATNGFDETFDAPRIANANSPLINCKVDTVNCAIGTYQPPFEGENTLVQLQLWVPTGKEYTLAFSEFEGLEEYNIYLVNDWEGTITPLSSLNEVKVNLQQGNNEHLYLVFKAGATVGVEEAHENKLSYSSTSDQLVVFGLEENTTITILNLNGQVVQTATTTNGMVSTSALAGGIYLARVSNSIVNETIKFYKN